MQNLDYSQWGALLQSVRVFLEVLSWKPSNSMTLKRILILRFYSENLRPWRHSRKLPIAKKKRSSLNVSFYGDRFCNEGIEKETVLHCTAEWTLTTREPPTRWIKLSITMSMRDKKKTTIHLYKLTFTHRWCSQHFIFYSFCADCCLLLANKNKSEEQAREMVIKIHGLWFNHLDNRLRKASRDASAENSF